MSDRLNMAAINTLPHPLYARFFGGDVWPVYDIDVETGMMRIDVCGLLQVTHFRDVTSLRDSDGIVRDADEFYTDYIAATPAAGQGET